MQLKKCTDCNVEKELTAFIKKKGGKYGVNSICYNCRSTRAKKYLIENRDSEKQRHKKYRLKNRDKEIKRSKKYREENKEKVYIGVKNALKKKPDYYRNYHRNYVKNKRKEDINFRLADSLRSRLNRAIKKNQKLLSAVGDLGCSIEELKVYLESKFQPGMTWENYGYYGWHVDHIIPLSKADLTNKEETKKVLHYTNLQPLWRKENQSKGNRYV